MTEAQAWRRVAEYMDAPRSPDDGRDVFLCPAIGFSAGVPLELRDRMRDRVRRHIDGRFTAYEAVIPESPEALTEVPYRVLACLWMALEADEEARLAVRGDA